MNIDYLIRLLDNKLIVLNDAKSSAYNNGDLERINALEAEILETQNTLYRLRLLQSAEQAAAVANTSVQTMMVAGVEAIQNTLNNPDIKVRLGDYDISSYATDPLHEQKVATILAGMPPITSPEMMNSYIQSVAPTSPVTGQMVSMSAKKYTVDARLLIALMQQDSSLGTAGVGASTFNPGNIGNTGTETRIFASWDEGVDAVAAWLNSHRAVIKEIPPSVMVEPLPPQPIESAEIASTTDSSIPPLISSTDQASSTPATSTPEIVPDSNDTTATSTTDSQ